MVNENVPEQVGVPEGNPPEGSVNPAGRLPLHTVKPYGTSGTIRCPGFAVKVAHASVLGSVGGLKLIVGQTRP